MHKIAEVVIPPVADIPTAIKQVMDSFIGDNEDHADWWDWWVIGGRWSGHKIEARIGTERLDAFVAELTAMKLTVSGFQSGRQSLNPASQCETVDAMWRERFPGFGDKCILFSHARDQYAKGAMHADDVCRVEELPADLTCARLIVAKPHWDKETHPNELEAGYMLATDFWNGVSIQKTDYAGSVAEGIQRAREYIGKTNLPQVLDSWLVVTVDYHN